MSVSITIGDVPDETRSELAARATLSGRSLQEYLRAKLIELAGQPDAEALVARIRARKAAYPVSLTADQVLDYRDEDRGPVVQQLLYDGPMSVGFRPTEDDLRVIDANRRQDEKTSDVIRRALRLLDREAWEARAREDMHRLRSEDLSAEPDEWEHDSAGNIKIVGTSLTVPARPQDQP
jgi:antitoxin ParD1/3/4